MREPPRSGAPKPEQIIDGSSEPVMDIRYSQSVLAFFLLGGLVALVASYVMQPFAVALANGIGVSTWFAKAPFLVIQIISVLLMVIAVSRLWLGPTPLAHIHASGIVIPAVNGEAIPWDAVQQIYVTGRVLPWLIIETDPLDSEIYSKLWTPSVRHQPDRDEASAGESTTGGRFAVLLWPTEPDMPEILNFILQFWQPPTVH